MLKSQQDSNNNIYFIVCKRRWLSESSWRIFQYYWSCHSWRLQDAHWADSLGWPEAAAEHDGAQLAAARPRGVRDQDLLPPVPGGVAERAWHPYSLLLSLLQTKHHSKKYCSHSRSRVGMGIIQCWNDREKYWIIVPLPQSKFLLHAASTVTSLLTFQIINVESTCANLQYEIYERC